MNNKHSILYDSESCQNLLENNYDYCNFLDEHFKP